MDERNEMKKESKIKTCESRKCVSCKLIKPITAFYNCKGNPRGKAYVCKPCNTIKKQESYIKQRLRKYGTSRIYQEIETLKKSIETRLKILNNS